MDLQNLFTFQTTLHLSIIFIIFTISVHITLSVDSKFEDCVPRNCGKGQKISYPFWIPNEQESYCGYPNFEITCNDDNPVLAISNDDYVVRDIFYANHSLSLANAAFIQDTTCPTPLHNFSLDGTPFNYSSSRSDLYFFYNCTSEPTSYPTIPVQCASNTTRHSFAVFHKEGLEAAGFAIESCLSLVNTPVNFDDDNGTKSLFDMNYTEILKMGFHLNWASNNCSKCERSGGHCGFHDNEFICFCSDRPHLKTCNDGGKLGFGIKLFIGIGVGILGVLFISIICCCRRIVSSKKIILTWKMNRTNDKSVEVFIRQHGSLAPKRYSYSDIKKITTSLKDKLGQGGYGGVYKGKLLDGRLVAVKVLKESKGNGEEFINEVPSISRTSHVNVVTLLGFCFEGRRRALIYEFMPNGSLEKFIYGGNTSLTNDRNLGWEKLYQIALGIARGLEYLHFGCNTRILHFDIKPHNILLDEDFCPKIADFGLAKLCLGKESIISMLGARGTIGYIAPEVYNRNFGGVSHKSDVYSYGSMILEMVGGRKNINVGVSQTSEIYFPHWIYKRLELENEFILEGVMTEGENEIARKMVLVGLWCIQTDPSQRPSISKVMNMLQGSIDALQIPPKPFLSSPSRSRANSSPPSTTSFLESNVIQ